MASPPTEFAVVMIVNREGSVLLQLRDEHAPKYPNVWCLPGGHREPGETAEETAHRELWEEAHIQANESLRLFQRNRSTSPREIIHYFYGVTAAVQADVIVGEGAAMVFVGPAEALIGRLFIPGASRVLDRFLTSANYLQACRHFSL